LWRNLLKLECAVIYYAFDRPRMIDRIFRRTPDAGDTKIATAASDLIEWTVHPSPRMASAFFNAPPAGFGMPQCVFNFLLLML
jgi:hypothetical protein